MNSSKISVGVVMGGISSEHDVSMNSGSIMLQNLDPSRFSSFPVIITRDNSWLWPVDRFNPENQSFSHQELCDIIDKPDKNWRQIHFPDFMEFPACDIFLLGLHGNGGEDGRLQGMLDLCQQKYTGSGCMGSALAMDKIMAKKIYAQNRISTPAWAVINSPSQDILKDVIDKLGFPMVLKVPDGGSSLGVEMAHDYDQLKECLSKLPSSDNSYILAEAFIKGREATCGYIENFKQLPPTEIIPLQDGFFNYEAKYDSNRTSEITPGNFSDNIISSMQELAETCHNILGLSVYSRTDFMLDDEDKLFVLETNSLPGFTGASILPQEAKAAGLNYSELLTKIIEESLKK